jgi:hypothetical protein
VAFGWRFRLYAIVSGLTVIVFGALTGVHAARLPAGMTPKYPQPADARM